MTAQQACVRADGLGERVLRTFDGVFHLGRRGRALLTGLVLEGNRARAAEQHDGKAVDELVRNIVQILARLGHGVIDAGVQRTVIERLEAALGAVLHKRLDDVFGNVAAGGQAVDGININGMPGDVQLAPVKVARAVEDRHDIFVRDRAGIASVWSAELFVLHMLTPTVVSGSFRRNIQSNFC